MFYTCYRFGPKTVNMSFLCLLKVVVFLGNTTGARVDEERGEGKGWGPVMIGQQIQILIQ